MLKLDFVIVLVLDSDWMVEMIGVVLDKQLGCCCWISVPQARVMSPSVHARANRSQRQWFSGRDSSPPWGFKGHPLNLNRVHSGSNCWQLMNLDCNRGNIWADCGHIHWYLLWIRDCMFRGWGRFRSQYNWWCARDCALQDICYGFNCACWNVHII